jgi:hypothetical protein
MLVSIHAAASAAERLRSDEQPGTNRGERIIGRNSFAWKREMGLSLATECELLTFIVIRL